MMLVTKGVPWNIAWRLPHSQRKKMVVQLGIIDGNEFDFINGKWIEPDKKRPMKGK